MVILKLGDCRTLLKELDENSIDSVITDPPYEIGFMGKAFDKTGISYDVSMWREVMRVLKPGGHLLAFGGTRTYHRMTCAIEDAGFEIRDSIHWMYGSGFPKSLDVSKAIDEAAGVERERVGKGLAGMGKSSTGEAVFEGGYKTEYDLTTATSDAAKQWDGWGTALKPSHEPVVLFQKPLTTVPLREIIERTDFIMEALLWSLSSAKFANASFTLSQNAFDATCVSVRWLVAVRHLLKSLEESDVTAMFKLPEEAKTFLSIAKSWSVFLDVFLTNESTFTTLTASGLIINLRIFNSWISGIIPESIIRAAMTNGGLWQSVSTAENLLNVSLQALQPIQTPTATERVGLQSANAIVTALANIAESLSLPLRLINDGSVLRLVITNVEENHKPIVLARKPLIGTVADNVEVFGTGGLNIDATRIASEPELAKNWERNQSSAAEESVAMNRGLKNIDLRNYTPSGRWPANVIFSHSADCQRIGTRTVKTGTAIQRNGGGAAIFGGIAGNVNQRGPAEDATYGDAEGNEEIDVWQCTPDCPVAELDRQSGQSGGSARTEVQRERNKGWCNSSPGDGVVAIDNYGDSGGASRFFYVAKTSRAEREAGCDKLPRKRGSEESNREEGSAGLAHARAGAVHSSKGVRNHHPTLKPIELMRYLVRLVTPHGGVVLDPFMGSGSTGCAAVIEEMSFIGFDLTPEYVEIAKARIAYWEEDARSLFSEVKE